MPTISVIVPVYKVEPYLHRCVDSILNQTFQDFELILVDDGSPDNCGAICDEYATKDSRVVVIHQENGGLSAARNAGIDWAFANSDSKWFTFIDSDDWVHEQYLQSLFAAVKDTGVLCSVGGYQSLKQEAEISVQTSVSPILLVTPDEFFGKIKKPAGVSVSCNSACSKLFASTLFRDVRFPYGKIHEDRFVSHTLHFLCAQIAIVPRTLYYYYLNPNSITRSKWTPARLSDFDALKKQKRFFRKHKATASYRATIIDEYNVSRWQCHDIKSSDYKHSKKYLSYLRKKLLMVCLLHPKVLQLTADQKQEVVFLMSPLIKRIVRHFQRKYGKVK